VDSTVLAGGGGGGAGPISNGQSTDTGDGGFSGNAVPTDGRGGTGFTGRGEDGFFPAGGGGGGQAGVGALARSSGGLGGPALVRINYYL
jgi:hypothetical protein